MGQDKKPFRPQLNTGLTINNRIWYNKRISSCFPSGVSFLENVKTWVHCSTSLLAIYIMSSYRSVWFPTDVLLLQLKYCDSKTHILRMNKRAASMHVVTVVTEPFKLKKTNNATVNGFLSFFTCLSRFFPSCKEPSSTTFVCYNNVSTK